MNIITIHLNNTEKDYLETIRCSIQDLETPFWLAFNEDTNTMTFQFAEEPSQEIIDKIKSYEVVE